MALGKASKVPFVGLCHGVQTTLDLIARYYGVPKEEISYPCGGINHMGWFLTLRHKGRDLYPKVTVDAKGRVTAGANLTAERPASRHAHGRRYRQRRVPAQDSEGGTDVGTRRELNLVQGTRASIAAADDPANDRVSVNISASPPEAGEITNALGYVRANRAGDHYTGPIACGPHQTIGGPIENMAKHSEDFAAAVWDKKVDRAQSPRTPSSRRTGTRLPM